MDKKIQIALLAPYNVYPARTGGKKFIALFHQYLAKLLPVSFISVADNDMPDGFTKTFHGVLGGSKLRYGNLFLFFRLKKLLLKAGITDLIIVHPYFGWLAWMLKNSTGVRLSLLSHNIESVRFKSMGKRWWRLLWQYEKKVHRIIDNNFFVTAEDMAFAIEHFGLTPQKCHVITYGIEWQESPSGAEKKQAAATLREQYAISEDEKILLFNGTLDYLPNIEAVQYILNDINPLLMQQTGFRYKIIVCGKGLPASFNELKAYANKNIIYAGFVDDINLFFKGSDIFLNPVITGGGIKTKLVEALGNGLSAVSSTSGAFGVSTGIVPGKLKIAPDHDWQNFCRAVTETDVAAGTGKAFFDHFYWGNIAAKVAAIISGRI